MGGGLRSRQILSKLNNFFLLEQYQYSKVLLFFFLAAPSSSRCLVVGLSVWWSVSPLVRSSETFLKKCPLEYQIVTKTYLKPTYLSTYLCDSSDNSGSSDSSHSRDKKMFYQKTFFPKQLFVTKNCYFKGKKLVSQLTCSHHKKITKQKFF